MSSFIDLIEGTKHVKSYFYIYANIKPSLHSSNIFILEIGGRGYFLCYACRS